MISMLLGWILIGLNIQHLLERFVLKLILFWEQKSVKNIVLKNLVAHRHRNRKTAIMYALSLSFVFFISVMITTNMNVIKMSILRSYGTKIYCSSLQTSVAYTHEHIEQILNANEFIEHWSWTPGPIKDTFHTNTFNVQSAHVSNIGKYFQHQINLFPVTPNFLDVTDDTFVVNDDGQSLYASTYSYTKQLYSAVGSQRVLIGEHAVKAVALTRDKLVKDDKLVVYVSNGDGEKLYFKVMSLAYFKLFPYYILKAFGTLVYPSVLIPVSAMPRMFSGIESVEDLWMNGLHVKIKSNVVNSEKDSVVSLLDNFCGSVFDYRDIESQVSEAANMLDLIFSFMTYVALFLCLFSLISSMYTNIMLQSKEIGIFRSLGLSKFVINKIYVYESLVLIVSASLIGIVVGCFLSFVIIQQQILFSQYPIEFVIPQSIVSAVITGAIVTSVLAVYFPLKYINKKQISQSLRDLFI